MDNDSAPAKSRGRGALLQQVIERKEREARELQQAAGTPESSSSKGRGQRLAEVCAKRNEELKKQRDSGYKTGEKFSQDADVTASVSQLKLSDVSSSAAAAPVVRRGTAGTKVNVITNYLRLKVNADNGVFEYNVKFRPEIDSYKLKSAILRTMDVIGGVQMFDGLRLYLPRRLSQNTYNLRVNSPFNESETYEVNIELKRQKRMGDCVDFYNVLFKRVMYALKYQRLNKAYFDCSAPKLVPQHKLEFWPGFVTAIDEYEGGVMLCCDASHKVLQTQTVLEYLADLALSNKNRVDEIKRAAFENLVGCVVFTKYNRKWYRIDDISWDINPRKTFSCRGTDITYADYYKNNYDITIRNMEQPILIHKAKRKDVQGHEETFFIHLVPEICYMSGLTDAMRKDFRLMRDVASVTRVTPNERMSCMRKFYAHIKENENAQKILSAWGLQFDDAPVQLVGRQLDPEDIYFGNSVERGKPNAEWNVTNHCVLQAKNLDNWCIVSTKRDERLAHDLARSLCSFASKIGIDVREPRVECLPNDITSTYRHVLSRIIDGQVQIVLIVVPNERQDRYSIIKKMCCVERPVASQVVRSRTLDDPKKYRGVVQKIALQMNCKMGGELWTVKMPSDHGIMMCGVDTFHDTSTTNKSVGAFVASTNAKCSRWFSKACLQSGKQMELIDNLGRAFSLALKNYHKINNAYPKEVIIFRDGVGDGQLKQVQEYEITQFKSVLNELQTAHPIALTFIVVQKRINTKIFAMRQQIMNAEPGTIVDYDITRRNFFDFFLVSQNVRQGAVTPVHYIVLQHEGKMSVDILQKITFKMCHMYYNWPGTVRVPAPCQYAHKLASLVGQSVHSEPHPQLSDALFYL